MEEIENEVQIFRINIFLILKNFVFVALILITVSIFSKDSFRTATYLVAITGLIIITGGLFFLSNIISDTLISINVYTKDRKVNFQFSRFIFLKSELTLGVNEFFYSFREEVGARGSKYSVFTVYYPEKVEIIKLTPYSSGWREEQIRTIIFLWQDLGVEEHKS